VKYDDIGSFPLPAGIDRAWIERNISSKEYEEMVQRAFIMKSRYVGLPNYPQFRDMISMFLDPIKNPEFQDDAYLIDWSKARIPELEYVERMKVERVRVCITGPFELYYSEFKGLIYEDILLNIAESVSRFARNACKYDNVECVSLDEPSLGLAPDLQPSDELISMVYDIEIPADLQIHLHDPLYYEKVLETKIDVIGIECAKDLRNMNFLDSELIQSYEKKLRIGVARSDIDGIIAEFNAKHNLNSWGNHELMMRAIDEIESSDKIFERLKLAYDRFNDLLAYIGPDCGLFSFPSQEHAVKLLENVKVAFERFKEWIM